MKIKRDRTWICSLCAGDDGPKEFKTIEEYQAHNKKFHPTGKPIKPTAPTKPPIQDRPKLPKKIELVYEYKGACPHCGQVVDTIPLDVDKKQTIVCWCNHCKKKLAQRSVVKL